MKPKRNKAMSVVLYLAGGLALLLLIILITGLILPSGRVVARKSVYNAPPEKVYDVVTNNDDWKYRTGLRELNIIRKDGDMEEWDEVTDDGSVIRFRTREKVPYSLYSFDMESKIFCGYWVSTYAGTGSGGTIFTATEHIHVKNPFIKTLSYLFFDIGKLMDIYQKDLGRKLGEEQ